MMPGGPFKPTTFQQNVPGYAQIQEDVESASNPAERHARHRDGSGPSPACSNLFRDWLSLGVLNSRSFDCSRVEETGEIIPYSVMQIPDHEMCSTGWRRRCPRERTAEGFRGFQKKERALPQRDSGDRPGGIVTTRDVFPAGLPVANRAAGKRGHSPGSSPGTGVSLENL